MFVKFIYNILCKVYYPDYIRKNCRCTNICFLNVNTHFFQLISDINQSCIELKRLSSWFYIVMIIMIFPKLKLLNLIITRGFTLKESLQKCITLYLISLLILTVSICPTVLHNFPIMSWLFCIKREINTYF